MSMTLASCGGAYWEVAYPGVVAESRSWYNTLDKDIAYAYTAASWEALAEALADGMSLELYEGLMAPWDELVASKSRLGALLDTFRGDWLKHRLAWLELDMHMDGVGMNKPNGFLYWLRGLP